MKKSMLSIILLVIFSSSYSQNSVLTKNGDLINEEIESFIGKTLTFKHKVEVLGSREIKISEVLEIHGPLPKFRKNAILKKNPEVKFFEETVLIKEEISKKKKYEDPIYTDPANQPASYSQPTSTSNQTDSDKVAYSENQNKTYFQIGSGFSKILGENKDIWKSGLLIDAELYRQIGNNAFFGIQLTYDRWKLDDEGFKATLGFSPDTYAASGNTSLIGIVPTFRFAGTLGRHGFQVFAQVGLGGFFSIDNYSVSAKNEGYELVPGPYGGQWAYVIEEYEWKSDSDDDKIIGAKVAAGICLGSRNSGVRIILYPAFTHLFIEEEFDQYITFNFGLLFGK